MKRIVAVITCLLTFVAFAQEEKLEFLEVIVESKEAYMSTQDGVVIFRKHAKTDPSAFAKNSKGEIYYIETTIHSVKKGETLSSIAKKHKTSIARIQKDNAKKSSKLAIGQKLKIKKDLSVDILQPKMVQEDSRIVASLPPGQNPAMINMPPPGSAPNSAPVQSAPVSSKPILTEKVVEVEEVKQETEETVSTEKIHVVKSGETLYGISKKYNMTVKQLKELNGLMLNNLSIGQKLKVK